MRTSLAFCAGTGKERWKTLAGSPLQYSYRTYSLSGGSPSSPNRTYGNTSFTPANNGMHDDVTCVITNDHDQRFEHGLVKFVMPKGYGSAQVTGGTLLQVDDSGDVAVFRTSPLSRKSRCQSASGMTSGRPASGLRPAALPAPRSFPAASEPLS